MNTQLTSKEVSNKSTYPKTYEECCDILQLEYTFELKDLTMDEEKLTDSFIRLKRCRDAYWKIAKEQMGWDEPRDTDDGEMKVYHTIVNTKKHYKKVNDWLLSFPSPEMRDTFYENFKDLIRECNELI